MRNIHSITTQRIQRGLSQLVLRKFRHERAIRAIIRKRDCDIRFRAAEFHIQLFRLHETFVTFGRKAQHQFTETNNFRHNPILANFNFFD